MTLLHPCFITKGMSNMKINRIYRKQMNNIYTIFYTLLSKQGLYIQ